MGLAPQPRGVASRPNTVQAPPKPGLNRLSIAIIVGGVVLLALVLIPTIKGAQSTRSINEHLRLSAEWQAKLPKLSFENVDWDGSDLIVDVVLTAGMFETTDDLQISHFSISRFKSSPSTPIAIPTILPGTALRQTYRFVNFPNQQHGSVDLTLESKSKRKVMADSDIATSHRKFNTARISIPPK